MTTLRLVSHNLWNRDANAPAWAEEGLDCSAEHRMRGMAHVISGESRRFR